ncbi:hypothetical protein HYQ44_015599 [Verticillium longisporum]|nr:hypothetical protein HYQ44_015599 [Verticillium longisporum]
MAPTNTGPSSGPLPTTTDFNTIYNRIALASAKQASFLTSMRAKYPSLQRPSASSSTTASSAGFSAPSTATNTGAGPTKAQIRAAREDHATLRFEPVNAGSSGVRTSGGGSSSRRATMTRAEAGLGDGSERGSCRRLRYETRKKATLLGIRAWTMESRTRRPVLRKLRPNPW